MGLQGRTLLVHRGGNIVQNGFEKWLQIVVVRHGSISWLIHRGLAGLGCAVDHWQIQEGIQVQIHSFLAHVLGQAKKQIGGL